MRRVVAVLACTTLLAACDQGGNETTIETTGTTPPAESTSAPATTAPGTPDSPDGGPPEVVGTVASGLEVPWGLDFLPNGDAIVTERDSRRVLRIAAGGDHEVTEIGTIDAAAPNNEAGLLGVAVSPDFARDRTAYFYVSTAEDNRVLRAEVDGNRLGDPRPVLTGIPLGSNHDGGRLAFGPDGFLYVSTGETGVAPELAQDRESLAGKILRITPEGEPAPDNPFGTEVWSWGHRNVEGLAFDGDGRLWASEFGQDAFDELNLIRPGDDYGWPEVEGEGGGDRYVDPALTWTTDEASPAGLAFAGDHLWMAALRGERLWRITVDGRRGTDPKAFLTGEHGRLRTVATAPDGALWLTTSNNDGRGTPGPDDDRILVINP